MPKAGGVVTGNVTSTAVFISASKVIGRDGLHVSASENPANQGLHVTWNGIASAGADFVNNRGSGSGYWTFMTVNADNTAVVGGFQFTADGAWTTGAFRPASDNAINCGLSSNRWANVYAANGSIVTSDERAKVDIEDTALGLDFLMGLRPVQYRMAVRLNDVQQIVTGTTKETVDSVDAHGNPMQAEVEYHVVEERVTPIPGVRTHDGLISQAVAEALRKVGVDPSSRAMWSLSDPNDPESPQALLYDEFVPPLIRALRQIALRFLVARHALPSTSTRELLPREFRCEQLST